MVWLDPRKIPAQAGFEPGIFRSRGGRINYYVNEAIEKVSVLECHFLHDLWNRKTLVRTEQAYLTLVTAISCLINTNVGLWN